MSVEIGGFCKQKRHVPNLHTLPFAGQNAFCFGRTLLTYMRKQFDNLCSLE